MPTLRAFFILVVFLFATLFAMFWQKFLLRFKLKQRKTFPNRFHRFLCRLFGIRIAVIGKPIQGRGVLMVANHVSYLDILVISAVARVSFVGRSDVADWTFFGTLSRLQETIFVERSRRSGAGESRNIMRRRLHDGDALVLFAEGTTTDGNHVIAFKSSLLGAAEAAIIADPTGSVPVQPVSIAYVGMHGMPMGREDRPFYAWYGDMELLPHLWEGLLAGPLDVVVEFHPPIAVDGGRKKIASVAEETIRDGLRRALSGGRPATADKADEKQGKHEGSAA
ncbi:MAG: 1-acyl-sn-glycerol-3-phosphate acyltransferase [Alphaproteobacteria bacterium]|nr:1-acyl-sn-glycerol-3-phosphate acyltransferase [Alphaproteobacteria bacterium]